MLFLIFHNEHNIYVVNKIYLFSYTKNTDPINKILTLICGLNSKIFQNSREKKWNIYLGSWKASRVANLRLIKSPKINDIYNFVSICTRLLNILYKNHFNNTQPLFN